MHLLIPSPQTTMILKTPPSLSRQLHFLTATTLKCSRLNKQNSQARDHFKTITTEPPTSLNRQFPTSSLNHCRLYRKNSYVRSLLLITLSFTITIPTQLHYQICRLQKILSTKAVYPNLKSNRAKYLKQQPGMSQSSHSGRIKLLR